MNTKSEPELKSFYSEQLVPPLSVIDKTRKKALRWIWAVTIPVAVIILLFVFTFLLPFLTGNTGKKFSELLTPALPDNVSSLQTRIQSISSRIQAHPDSAQILSGELEKIQREATAVQKDLSSKISNPFAPGNFEISVSNPQFITFLWIGGMIISVGLLVFTAFRASRTVRKLKDEFKTVIIPKIVSFYNSNLTYQKDRFISRTEFSSCRIFEPEEKYSDGTVHYSGEDYVSGILEKTRIEFCELKYYKEKIVKFGKETRRSRRWIFRGLFAKADFNKNFTTDLVVLPDTAEKLFGFIGQALQSWNFTRDKLVKLENPEFEKEFVVYGNDPIESRYILSPALMTRMTDYKRKTKRKVHFSFRTSNMYLAIPISKDLFEPSLFKTLVRYEPIREYYESIALVADVVTDLDLNTRIWSKR
ncbi:MAG: DUF3137 domain-containing protein [Bacteroidetes bacterium]|nr:DUF3137 domain-containing protein [Bacteroidota bacterium]